MAIWCAERGSAARCDRVVYTQAVLESAYPDGLKMFVHDGRAVPMSVGRARWECWHA